MCPNSRVMNLNRSHVELWVKYVLNMIYPFSEKLNCNWILVEFWRQLLQALLTTKPAFKLPNLFFLNTEAEDLQHYEFQYTLIPINIFFLKGKQLLIRHTAIKSAAAATPTIHQPPSQQPADGAPRTATCQCFCLSEEFI